MKAFGIIVVLAVLVGLLLGGQYSPANISRAVTDAQQKSEVVNAQALRDQIVVPAQAQADARSVLARTDQQIKEDAHQQALRHQGEVAALEISNTLRLNEVNAAYSAAIASITVKSEVEKADAAAQREERAAAARIATTLSIAAGAFFLVVGIGAAFAVNRWVRNRARVSVLADDGLNQTLWIDGRIVHKTAQQLGEATIYEAPSLPERVIMLLTAASIARSQKSLEPLAQLRQLSSVTLKQSADPATADLLKLNQAAVMGHVALAAIQAQPAAAQQVARQSAESAVAQLAPADELPELVLLDDPNQRAHMERVLEAAR